ncbi:aprataxin [Talaromyces islandicus]|uniref:Aprataxin-like protein n=1 Tax=Talaromyces islandicus TaxID=28573 RepID=A0A0U1LMT8_TALIS|nr:aprataxin [Talaromyces islandicus]
MAHISGSDASDAEAPEASAKSNKTESLTETGKRNAFTELMSSKTKQLKQPKPTKQNGLQKLVSKINLRDGLGVYIEHPETFPSSVVIYYNDDFVAINDLYPKSSLHLLLLPRDPSKFFLHPFDAFEDDQFLQKVRAEVKKLRTLAAGELRRRYGKYSSQETARREAMEQDPPADDLPQGRDWEKELMVGIHAKPSMNHLHIHVLSVDRYSDKVKHRKHYNSFATPFFVDIDDFPLAQDDPRRDPGHYLKLDLICWRCSRNFGNKFQQLKEHLEEEYKEWKSL